MEKETAGFPFFVFSYDDARIQKLHFCLGNLSRWDASLDNEEKKPRCDWYDEKGDFLLRPDKLPRYGPNFMWMFMTLAKFWGKLGRRIRSARTEAAVKEICNDTVVMCVARVFFIAIPYVLTWPGADLCASTTRKILCLNVFLS